jgi:transcriptional regulator with XRE-family HTH domain
MANIADNLFRARKAKRWTRRQLQAESGVHMNTIADIETGRNQEPSVFKVLNLAKALGVTTDELVAEPRGDR